MTARLLLLLTLVPANLIAQTPATRYEGGYAEVIALAPRGDRVASVSNLVLQRDVARFTLRSGTLALLTAVGGRTVGAVFRGDGVFNFSPPTDIEQARLARFEKSTELGRPFTELVLLFADSTAAELERTVKFAAGDVSALRGTVKSSLDYISSPDTKWVDPDLMGPFLNGETTGVFYAQVNRSSGDPLMFMITPADYEAISLAHGTKGKGREVICQFPPQGGSTLPAAEGVRPRPRAYRMEITLKQTGSGDLSFAAATRLELITPMATGPWIPLQLFYKLQIDSARWEDGPLATVFRGKDAGTFWVRLDRQPQRGEARTLLLYYQGDLIDRFGDFFFIKDPIAWFPLSLDGPEYATFDLTYHTPAHLLLASVGDRVDSAVGGRVATSHWLPTERIRFATFNLGLFENYEVREPDVPPVTVMISEEAHRALSKVYQQQRHMKENVGTDVAQSLKFFQHVYGPTTVKRFYATEVPYFEGIAFPGMVDLSWVTFQVTDDAGDQAAFRAHEVAHQWWGIGVDVATYHDRWLAEGFANFSGLWYLEASRKDNSKYFDMLHRWRTEILLHRDEPSPIWLGTRASYSKDQSGYDVLIYQKGAWVLHMLRVLMIDLQTVNEDRFTEMMRDYYRTYRGQRASTADFQRIVEQYAGISMDWFFKEWVYGTGIPSYRVGYTTVRADNGKFRTNLHVTQENVPDDFMMYVPVTVDLGGGREVRLRVKVAGPSSDITLPLLPSEPKSIKFNALDGVLCEVKMLNK
jgi:hypothetical protein